MTYNKNDWHKGEIITADKLNNIENGIDVLNTNLDSEMESTSLLKSRVDQIVAPTGEAPNPAEITDARIGVDGSTYDSLGNAIRKQIDNVKGSIMAPVISNSVSGEVVSFSDGSDNINVLDAKVDIEPEQNFNGYDHAWGPGCGKNICSPLVVGQYYDIETGVPISGNNSASTEKIAVNNLDAGITLSCTAEFRSMLFAWDQDGNFIGRTAGGVNAPSKSWVKTEFSSGSGNKEYDTIRYIALRFYTADGTPTDINEILSYQVMLELGTTATAYEPYANICPISPYSTATVKRCGLNLLENNATVSRTSAVTIEKNSDGSLIINGETSENVIAIYNFKTDASSGNQNNGEKTIPNGTWYVSTGNENKKILLQIVGTNSPQGASGITTIDRTNDGNITINDSYKYNWVRLLIGADTYENEIIYPMICPVSDENDTYKPYKGMAYNIQFPSSVGEVYGGTLDATTGTLTVTKKSTTFDGTLEYSTYQAGGELNSETALFYYQVNDKEVSSTDSYAMPNIISNYLETKTPYAIWRESSPAISTNNNGKRIWFRLPNITTLEECTEYLTNNPLQVVYNLETPVTYSLDPVQIKTLLGKNTIYSDTGNVSVNYVIDTKTYIDNKFEELKSLINS